ncbi:hypothetical protein EJ04DRAFT_190754 [Polyplosphaeria fusca]|uniref:Uncharacterized protein n=1 Tax=Polyplosphaeria fusca TaxID=682080 RepID=A0A9P4V0U4_9PLEO|nr:hypothetical protein EJ04DRAFT_190754 [Polyplosphaeria fusca]
MSAVAGVEQAVPVYRAPEVPTCFGLWLSQARGKRSSRTARQCELLSVNPDAESSEGCGESTVLMLEVFQHHLHRLEQGLFLWYHHVSLVILVHGAQHATKRWTVYLSGTKLGHMMRGGEAHLMYETPASPRRCFEGCNQSRVGYTQRIRTGLMFSSAHGKFHGMLCGNVKF